MRKGFHQFVLRENFCFFKWSWSARTFIEPSKWKDRIQDTWFSTNQTHFQHQPFFFGENRTRNIVPATTESPLPLRASPWIYCLSCLLLELRDEQCLCRMEQGLYTSRDQRLSFEENLLYGHIYIAELIPVARSTKVVTSYKIKFCRSLIILQCCMHLPTNKCSICFFHRLYNYWLSFVQMKAPNENKSSQNFGCIRLFV